jgi:hypothetical protein
MWTEPAVVRFIGALSREAAWIRFVRQAGHWNRLGFGFFAIEDRATGAFVGEAGFRISAARSPGCRAQELDPGHHHAAS